MNADVGCGAESAICVVRGAVAVGMSDLHGAQDDDQKDADEREENSPGMVSALSLACVTHIKQLYHQGWSLLMLVGIAGPGFNLLSGVKDARDIDA
jgi:hypothetical protein